MKASMRIIVLALTALLATAAQASATVGFSCQAKDKTVTLEVSGAYGMSIGSGSANFGAIIEIKDPRIPDVLRKVTLTRSDLSQNWFNDRDLRLMTHWEPQDTGLYRELVMIISTRSGKAEGSPFRGRYTLMINFMQSTAATDATRLELHGAITCGTD
jgi:hypothetical protein